MNLEMEKILIAASPWIKAILILLIGHFVISYIVKITKRVCGKSKLDKSLIAFLVKTLNIFLHALIVLSALNTVGISTTGLIAALSAGVVAIGLALKDSLGNIAGGVLLLISPRFHTGDYIEASGNGGTVIKVDLMHTTIKTPDNRVISIPNGTLVNSDITNYSGEEKRRVDIEFGIPYECDAEKAKEIIKNTISGHSLVINDPDEPMVRVISYGDSTVNIITRSWCKASDYWTVYFDLMEQVRTELEKEGISIPYNQLDVHIKKD